MENFTSIKIEDSLKNSLSKMNFIKPTPIQGMAIPVALEGKDILGTAQTGTGKTLAFSIPLINKLILDKDAFALVMCPTRELASQVMETIMPYQQVTHLLVTQMLWKKFGLLV